MNIIKNLHKLDGAKPELIKKMEFAAGLHRRNAAITFKIVEYEHVTLTIQIAQGKSAAGNYFTDKRLIEIVHETFDPLFPGYTMKVQPIAYKESVVNKVTPEWIRHQMNEKGVKLKDMIEDTGIDKTQLSALMSPTSPRGLSQPMKALFYYYFLCKGKRVPLLSEK